MTVALHPAALTLVTAALLVQSAHALVDEAHSVVMEGVTSYVENGFTIRADYWNGNLPAGEQRLIRHQLFRGNEYWFWIGTSLQDCKIEIEVYDGEGRAVSVEKKTKDNFAGVRVTPASTSSHYILIRLSSQKHEKIDWALVYGYR